MSSSKPHLPSLRGTLLLLFLSVSGLVAIAQDIHFSQFYNAPFNLNPAMVGQFDGAYRFIGNQRNQWRSITVPYNTFGLSVDASDLELPDGILNSKDGALELTHWNVGLSFHTDKTGDSRLKTNMIHLVLGRDNPIGAGRLAWGVMLGYTGMSIDYSALNYDNQWNGLVFDPSIDPNETYARSARGYLSLNLGGLYQVQLPESEGWSLGASIFNLTNPKQSFFDNGLVKLDWRLNFHGQYKKRIQEQWLVEPMFKFSSQGTYKEFNFGGLAHYEIETSGGMNRTVYAGVLGRAKDAGYLIAGMHYDDWEVGISYDINTSNLKPASNGRGGFEFSAIYIIPKPPKPVPFSICPDWI